MSWRKRVAPRVVTAVLILLAAGCWPAFHEPEVRLASIALGGLGLRGGTLVAEVVVTNPNSFRLRTHELSYALDLGDGEDSGESWVRLGEGNLDRDFSVEARDSAVIEVPLDFTYSGLGSAIRQVIDRGTVDYRIAGDLRVSEPVSRRVPFRRSGTVSFLNTQ